MFNFDSIEIEYFVFGMYNFDNIEIGSVYALKTSGRYPFFVRFEIRMLITILLVLLILAVLTVLILRIRILSSRDGPSHLLQ
jgi:hypothetical protein